MGNRRRSITPFPPWATKKENGVEKRFVRLGNSLLLDQGVLSLNPLAFKVYVYMYLESGGKAEFEFPYSKYKRIASKGGFQKALHELCKAGFIEVMENNANLRKPNRYRFVQGWKDKIHSQ